jgi:hypothetical protein
VGRDELFSRKFDGSPREPRLLIAGKPKGGSEYSNDYARYRAHKPIMVISIGNSREEDEWADMVGGALFYVCVLVGLAHIANKWDKKRSDEKDGY